jgi:hypothetical protein
MGERLNPARRGADDDNVSLLHPSPPPANKASLALNFAHYNFCRSHSTLKVTPAMESGITNHVWSLEEMLSTISSVK